MSSRIVLLLAATAAVAALTSGCTPDEPQDADAPGVRDATTRPAEPRSAEKPIAPPSTQAASLTGTLRGGMMAIGGETTGWTLVGDGAVGGVELDVSKVNADAKRLDGKRVTVSGTWVDKKYVERGTVRQLRVDSITQTR